jgi:hypothetical protein
MLLSVVLTVLALAVLAVGGVLCTAVPFVVAVDMAERRCFSPARWGAAQLVLLVLGGLVGYVALKHLALLLLPAVLLCWMTPLALWVLSADDTRIGGRQGAHEA